MKTSNKLLSGLCAVITLCMLIGMVITKGNMNIYPEDKEDTNLGTKVIAESYNSNVLKLNGGDFRMYTLDPTSTAITARADKRNLDEINIDDNDAVYFYRIGDQRIFKKIHLTIGTLGKDALVVDVEGHSKLYTAGAVDSKLELNVSRGSEVEMQYEGPELALVAEDNVLVSLRGRAAVASIKNEDNSAVHGQEFVVDTLTVDLIDDAYVKLQKGLNVEGKVEDDAALIFKEITYTHKLKMQDDALVKVEQQ